MTGRLLLPILFGFVLSVSAVHGQSNALTNAKKEKALPLLNTLVKLRQDNLQLQCERKVLEQEKEYVVDIEKVLEKQKNYAQPVENPDAEQLLKKIQLTWELSHDKRDDVLKGIAEKAEKAEKKALDLWAKAERKNLDLLERIVDSENQLGISWDSETEYSMFDLTTVAVFVFGLFVVFCSFRLRGRINRVENRKRKRAKEMTAAVVAFVLAIHAFGCSNFPVGTVVKNRDDRWISEITKIKSDIQTCEKDREKLKQDVEKAADTITKMRKPLLELRKNAFPFPKQEREENTKPFFEQEQKAYQTFREILVSESVREQATKKGLELVGKISQEEKRLNDLIRKSNAHHLQVGVIRCVWSLLCILVAFLVVNGALRKRRAILAQQGLQCPCCLNTDTLEEFSSDAKDTRYPERKYLQCNDCGYQFRKKFQQLPRLSFPTVGIRASGKTHWLVTAYEQVVDKKIPARVHFEKSPSLADDAFDAQITEILENHRSPRPTVYDLPYPLIFFFRDKDRSKTSSCMLNLFDFSGEIMMESIKMSDVRKRALFMDGFCYFLDPTQYRGKELKAQRDSLERFHQEMRDMRNLDVGEPLTIPVAVCITKWDLLLNKNLLSRASLPWIKKLRESFANDVTLDEIHYRSELCKQVLPQMIPGFNVVDALEENFGNQYLFFPLSPVSLEESELGVEDLSKRTVSPDGILEPVLWLLHMHGYNVFDRI